MALEDETPRLGCGRRIDDLWEVIDQPLNPHEKSCPDCQQARVALYNLASVTEAMRQHDPGQAALQPSGRVKETIMMVARAEVRRGRRIQLARTEAGTIHISAHALAALARFAADTLTGVRARRCSIDPFTPAARTGDAVVESSDIRITLKVAVSSALSIPPTMEALRERVIAVVSAQVALNSRQIDVIVEDLYDV
ncbi:hypothetical protein [Arthrobacter sp. H14]|uniref:hypothetical protein n=1 Tax=Arthrobacter sp. H14 TaxID=1312959 RepID=UPI00047A4A30|nr:hypothetical protein [Arthrobacter sp. H14]